MRGASREGLITSRHYHLPLMGMSESYLLRVLPRSLFQGKQPVDQPYVLRERVALLTLSRWMQGRGKVPGWWLSLVYQLFTVQLPYEVASFGLPNCAVVSPSLSFCLEN